MGKRPRAELLADNIPQLQNLIKRDPTSYRDEFLMQWRQWESGIQIFNFKPDEERLEFGELINFISHVVPCYPRETKGFPETLVDLLTQHHVILAPSLRKSMVQALILMRNKDVIETMTVMPLFFTLFRVSDKELRKMLQNHIVNDIKNSNAKAKNNRLNKLLQNFMYKMLNDANEIAARKSLEVMVSLYHKNVWNDAKTVNVIAEACFSQKAKVVATALHFFLGTNDSKDADADEDAAAPDISALKHRSQINKKKGSRKSEVDKALASIKKKERQKARVEVFNFSALHLLNDPQGMTEKLFQRLKTTTANTSFRFELRLQIMNLISRLIGVHKLIVLPFYDFVIPYLKPSQREVASILACVAQSSHELVPPDSLAAVVQAIADNFVWSNAAAEVVTAGLNSLREICSRCPLAMPESLLKSLIEDYKNNREKSTMVAGRSLLGLFREVNPLLLRKKDRGKAASLNIKEFKAPQYGAVQVNETVDGAEFLNGSESHSEYGDDGDVEDEEEDEEGERFEDGAEGNEEGWEDESDGVEATEDPGQGWDGWEVASLDSDDESEERERKRPKVDAAEDEPASSADAQMVARKPKKKAKEVTVSMGPKQAKLLAKAIRNREVQQKEVTEQARKEAVTMASQRIFTDEEFARMREKAALKKAEKMAGVQKKREENDDESDKDDSALVDVHRITSGVKRKMTYEERMEHVKAGREGRGKFGSNKGVKKAEKGASTTNREKAKKSKNFMMIVHKREVKGKAKRSLRDKSKLLRQHITKQKKGGH
ncbi:Severe Depolymerization of Actin [Irineochytrium annulatum]|nr:Severe Depolymerization of Actin [Irineochytrium annulatum]